LHGRAGLLPARRRALQRDEHQALEQLCRHINRSALAYERVQYNAAGPVVLKLETPWHDSTTNLVMSQLKSMQRLTGPVARQCRAAFERRRANVRSTALNLAT
jgi:hypothetical protein